MIETILPWAQKQMKKEAKQTRASIHGRVSEAHSGRRYDVTTADGKVYRKVSCAIPVDRFEVGMWVILEFTTTDWQIVGYSGQAASNS